MVKSVVGEETRMKSAEERLFQSNLAAQVGLIIGKLSSSLDRGFVFDLIPTPANDAGNPACSVSEYGGGDKRKGSKGKSQSDSTVLEIDREWVAEHARQVSRMMLGGMNVVGLYVWATESSFKASSTILFQTVKEISTSAPFYEIDLDERLLIHISYSPRRWSCRNCKVGSSIASTNFWPCDFKLGKFLPNIQTFRCTYNFELRLPLFQKDALNGATLRDILHDGISSHDKELKGAKALVDGDMVVDSHQFSSDRLHEVELLLTFGKDVAPKACSEEEVIGIIMFSGVICSFAYLCPKEPISQAILDLKGDIFTSLESRLDIICDDLDVVSSFVDDGKKVNEERPFEKSTCQLSLPELIKKPCSLFFPRRVFVPWLAGVSICDYLQPSETYEDLRSHCQEMMSMEIATDSEILELELNATTTPIAKNIWDVVSGNLVSDPERCASTEEPVSSEGEGRKILPYFSSLNIIIAIAILLFSIFLALSWSLLVP